MDFKPMHEPTFQKSDPYSDLWLTLIPLLHDEDLIRFIRRASIKLPESSMQRSDLITYLEAELLSREAVAELKRKA
jgi:hypothetical protein